MIEYMKEKGGSCMEVTFFGTSAGLPTKERNTQSIALNLEPYSNSVWLFDVGEERNTKSYIIQ